MILINTAIALCAGLILFYFHLQRERHMASEVLESIAQDSESSHTEETRKVSRLLSSIAQKNPAEEVSLWLPLGLPVFSVCVAKLLLGASLEALLMIGLLALSIGYLAEKARVRHRISSRRKRMEFFLPIVMERVVMAVQSGLDIIPALQAIIELDSQSHTSQVFAEKLDPVTELLSQVVKLTEAGLSFENSLKEVAERTDCVSVRHAFIHLAIAHKEGGELVLPLRELSDATQLSYQEGIEEEIAAMPIRATLPLLCTFAGLVIFFITSPMIQILNMTVRIAPK